MESEEYANSNNSQDDAAVIATYLPLTGDDHAGTLATATTLAGPTVSVSTGTARVPVALAA